jgi:Predicted lipase
MSITPKARKRIFAAATLLAALLASSPLKAQGQQTPRRPAALDFSAYGFATSVDEIVRLEMLNAGVRYDPAAAIEENWKQHYDRVSVVEISATKGRYAIFEDDAARRIDVAVRGTANLRNGAFDLEFLKKRSERLGIYLHSGFEASAEAIYADLEPRIAGKLGSGYALRITGHSLGAAAAIILGMLFESDGREVEKVLASAPPKVTDAEGWARYAKLRVIRLACPYDPVPFLPPKGLVYGKEPYVQGGMILFLLDGHAFTVAPASYYDALPAAVETAFKEGKHFKTAEHLLPNYLAHLLPKESGVEFVDPAEWKTFAAEAEGAQE